MRVRHSFNLFQFANVDEKFLNKRYFFRGSDLCITFICFCRNKIIKVMDESTDEETVVKAVSDGIYSKPLYL
jgi:predicted lipid carrier protein YhbT